MRKIAIAFKESRRVWFRDLLYAKFLTCPHPHARIKTLDTAAAEKMPGVAYVLTYKNAPKPGGPPPAGFRAVPALSWSWSFLLGCFGVQADTAAFANSLSAKSCVANSLALFTAAKASGAVPSAPVIPANCGVTGAPPTMIFSLSRSPF